MTGIDPSGLGMAALWAATFLLALASGLVPFVINTEAYLLGVALLTDASPGGIVALATAGQMLGKFAVYQAGRGSLNVRWIRRRAAGLGVLGVSAITGIPPFYAVSFMCGVLRMPRARFLAIGTAGRAMRFAALFSAPALFQ